MPIIHQCTDPDCPILTMGDLCLDHEHAAPVAQPNSRFTSVTAARPRGARRGVTDGRTARRDIASRANCEQAVEREDDSARRQPCDDRSVGRVEHDEEDGSRGGDARQLEHDPEGSPSAGGGGDEGVPSTAGGLVATRRARSSASLLSRCWRSTSSSASTSSERSRTTACDSRGSSAWASANVGRLVRRRR